ncbi:MAG: EFR1 family ferrodoxin [Oscillospiraceae bacterium]
MIFYFTATGNSLAAAKHLAQATGDRIASVTDYTDVKKPRFDIPGGERVGLVFPVYYWGMPPIVSDFIKKLSAEDFAGKYVYVVVTMGGGCGDTIAQTAKAFQKIGIAVSAGFDVAMPENYVLMFRAPTREKAAQELKFAAKRLDEIAGVIREKKKTALTTPVRRAKGLLGAVAQKYYLAHRKTKKFRLSGACTHCGLCERICPVGAIRLDKNGPVWHGDCLHCMGCINRCPVRVIEYGKATAKHGRYVHPTAFR